MAETNIDRAPSSFLLPRIPHHPSSISTKFRPDWYVISNKTYTKRAQQSGIG
ncbi:hypothetical protein PGT21_025313 [Puccinia graminis f. sp. tritici]|uniref:Uncharacterized protein n=1 Tax=Puccinia graminis f. sp. tritici TaxID=56615 RepID=A0A5B0MTT8_PUCGR|nr:hypothetical protein PGT21_025313 [Puccinia graminis f. sp. tritici]